MTALDLTAALARIEELTRENQELAEQLRSKTALGNKAVASFQQRALQMEVIRQQNEELDKLATELAKAKRLVEERANEVEEAARLKSEFLANFSHEIRTPLNGILGYCDLLMREEGSRLTPHGRRDLNVVKSNARTLLALINDILDLSKIEAGRVDVAQERVDVGALIDECAQTVRETLKGKDVSLHFMVEEAARSAISDSLKLRQVMLNLLSNAAKFTETGEIVIEARARDTALVVTVEDTGIGVPPEQLAVIFQKFRQVEGSSTRKYGGTGLGLAIVREVTRVLGGEVTVQSTVGRGTTFTVTLPGVLDGGALPATARDVPSNQQKAVPVRANVLVVDDDPMVQQLLKRQLEAEGFEVLVAADGMEGLKMARKHRPSLILLDVHLPKLDGWHVLAQLKADIALSYIPVVIISIEEQRARGFSLGACEYLVKPIEPERLVSVVRNTVSHGASDVLVCDDDDSTRELVARHLRRAGFTISEARNGEEALNSMRANTPHLLVLDLVMPRVDGFEVLQTMRAERLDVPVLVLTGKDLSSEEERGLRESMARLITKGGVALESVVEQAKNALLSQRNLGTPRLPKVLYIEDSAQNRDIVRRYLSGEFEVVEAEDGEYGIERAAREVPELILMDLSLPRLDGWEATRRLKADAALAHIPVVALTAHASQEDRDRAMSVGCIEYLTKPIERDHLINTIKRFIRAPQVTLN